MTPPNHRKRYHNRALIESAAINHTIHDMRIDYVYVIADLAGRVCAARIDDDAQGSDHQPVWVELEL